MSNSASSTTSGRGISFGGLLAIVFIVLKLTGVITWSWWWVLAPLWIPGCVAVGLLVIAGLAGLVVGPRRRDRDYVRRMRR